MREKYDERYEQQIAEIAENRLTSGNYRIFDSKARVVRRARIGGAENEQVLVIVSGAGDVIVLTGLFEQVLANAICRRRR